MFFNRLSGLQNATGGQPLINYFIICGVIQIKHAFLGYTPKKIYRFTVYLSLPKNRDARVCGAAACGRQLKLIS